MRKLRWLRIDDDLQEVGLVSTALSPAPRLSIDVISVNLGDKEVHGIRSWKSAKKFWVDFSPERRPDLVTGDVSFKDKSSPLFELSKFAKRNTAIAGGVGGDGEDNGVVVVGVRETTVTDPDEDESFAIPTGLSHFKPFAAIARAIGAPIGIAIHTQASSRWKTWREEQKGTPRSVMALLAAHEIGELAAIMGTDLTLIERDGIEGCWEWLRDEANVRTEALPVAMRRFRKQLANAEVLPDDWHKLHKWCVEMERLPVPITDKPGSDPGLTLLLPSGQRDTISIRSLFADAEVRRADIHFDIEPLPRECFRVVEDANFYELSSTHLPKIGALLAACRTLKSDYDDALVLLKQFPERVLPAAGVQLCESGKQPPGRAHALAVFFRMIDHSWIRFQNWKAAYNDKPWDIKAEAFTEDAYSDNHPTLLHLTRQAEEALWNSYKTDDFSFDEIETAFAPLGLRRKTKGMLVDFLLSAERLTNLPASGTYRLRSMPNPNSEFVTVLPAGLKRSDFKAMDFPDIALRPAWQYVQSVFGHQAIDNHLTRLLLRTFPGSHDTAGAFLRAFDEGHASVKIKEICRTYARDVLHWSEATWPPSIRIGCG